MVFYVDSQKSSSAEEIAFLLNKCILQYPGRWSELVFLCIGSDREKETEKRQTRKSASILVPFLVKKLVFYH